MSTRRSAGKLRILLTVMLPFLSACVEVDTPDEKMRLLDDLSVGLRGSAAPLPEIQLPIQVRFVGTGAEHQPFDPVRSGSAHR